MTPKLKICTLSLSALSILGPASPLAAASQSPPLSPAAQSPRETLHESTTSHLNVKRRTEGCGETYAQFSVSFDTDSNEKSKDDNSWILENALNGDIVNIQSNFERNMNTSYHTCLPICGIYKFTMLDKSGNGLEDGNYTITVNDETLYESKSDGGSEFKDTTTFIDLSVDECPEPSRRIVYNKENGKDMCLQPDGTAEDAQIVWKPCRDVRIKQRWIINEFGQLKNLYHDNKCATKTNSLLMLKECQEGFHYLQSFIVNDVTNQIHMMNNPMKVLKIVERENLARIRPLDTEHYNPHMFQFQIQHVYDGPSDEFPLIVETMS